MTDIIKCNNEDCKLKDKCYRFTAPASNYQSYFSENPDKDGECDRFWDNKGRK